MAVNLQAGVLHGLHPYNLNFQYPFSVIAGKNGFGKSTIFTMACCAYHNTETGYTPSGRSKNDNTSSDFSIQAHFCFLPGEDWPEKVFISPVQNNMLACIALHWEIPKQEQKKYWIPLEWQANILHFIVCKRLIKRSYYS